jgi:protein-S-isoprenylcysteine O-methyltransferase Ste14
VAPQPRWPALVQDLCLLLLFVVPHSLLARGLGRRWLNRPFGPAGERPLYVLVTGLSLGLLALGWRTSGPLLWNHEGVLGVLARALQLAGLALAAWATAVLGAGATLGLPDLRALRRGLQPPAVELTALPPYRHLRHPTSLGNLLLLACMPEVTLDRALLLVGLGAWILLSAPWEERDAELSFGEAYRAYRSRTPRWIPRLRREEG